MRCLGRWLPAKYVLSVLFNRMRMNSKGGLTRSQLRSKYELPKFEDAKVCISKYHLSCISKGESYPDGVRFALDR